MEKVEDLPDEFYIGKEFIEDTETEKTVIEILFYSPAILDSFELLVAGKKIIGNQKSGLLKIYFEQTLSKKLIENLMWDKSEEYIIGYISKYLPGINEEILRQRYNSGHFLIRTFSTLDISRVNIKVPSITEGPIFLSWPQSITSFPPAKQLAEKNDEIYIRDFIDAGNAYLAGNYDDCIRKSITSVENAFRKYNLKSNSSIGWKRFFPFFFPRERKFDKIVKNIIYANDIGRKVIAENLLFLYKLRNKIVHDKFRIRSENGWVGKKAIGTLNYLYQFLSKDQEAVGYISYLSGSFQMLDNFSKGESLDRIKQRESVKQEITEDVIIDSEEKMNTFMFNNLRIIDKEKSFILKNKLPTEKF